MGYTFLMSSMHAFCVAHLIFPHSMALKLGFCGLIYKILISLLIQLLIVYSSRNEYLTQKYAPSLFF